MTKRVLDLLPAELASLTAKELLQAVAGSEGRVLAAETIGITPPLLSDVTNAEFAASMGADLLLLNMFDVWEPRIVGLPETRPEDVVRRVKELTGRMIGINLEPVDPAVCAQNVCAQNEETIWAMSRGRYATAENAQRAMEMGVDLIVLTGNPGNGVSNEAIVHSLESIRAQVGDGIVLAAGKMHASGVRHHHRVCARPGQLCPQPGLPDHRRHRHLAGGSGHRHHPPDCSGVQDDRHRYPPHWRFRLCGYGPAGEHHGLQRGHSRHPPHLPAHGGLAGPQAQELNRRRGGETAR